MSKKGMAFLIGFLLVFFMAGVAQAELVGVSGTPDPAVDIVGGAGDPATISVSLANGFPLWYEDTVLGFRAAPCLDFGPIITPEQLAVLAPGGLDAAQQASLGAVNAFCFTESLNLNPAQPVAFPTNFPELFSYYNLSMEVVPADLNGNAVDDELILIEMGVFGSFVNEATVDGEQIVFRDTFIRLRNLLPTGLASAQYLIETPYGDFTLVVSDTESRFAQTIGPAVPPDPGTNFLEALRLAVSGDFIADRGGSALSSTSDIDEFLVWSPATITNFTTEFNNQLGFAFPTENLDSITGRPSRPAVVDEARQTYFAVPQGEPAVEPPPLGFFPIADLPVTNSLGVNEFISITPPAGVDLGAGAGLPLVINNFSLQGRIFNSGANVNPTGVADVAAALGGSVAAPVADTNGVPLDVTLNDTDPVSGTNVHGIDQGAILPLNFNAARIDTQATAADLPRNANNVLTLAASATTREGGTVRRAIQFTTGKTIFQYTAPAGFAGDDQFMYVVQDTGGRLSNITAVDILVENVAMTAQYRAKIGKWTVSGTTSDVMVPDPQNPGLEIPNTINIFVGSSIPAGATPAATAAVAADGTWKFEGKTTVSPGAGAVSCRSANGVELLNIPLTLL